MSPPRKFHIRRRQTELIKSTHGQGLLPSNLGITQPKPNIPDRYGRPRLRN